MQVYLNGEYVDHDHAVVPVDDRGFLFADGVYEVVRVYAGRPFMIAQHVARMQAGLRALRIDPAAIADFEEVARHLLRVNDLEDAEATIYAQVTRGAAPRKHAFPTAAHPTVYVATRPYGGHPPAYMEDGVATITVPDTRWSRCDIKSISLLPNVLANQAAHEADAFEALFVRDGVVIEGSHSNLFGVFDGELVTFPCCNYILAGITRALVIDIARELAIPVSETGILWDRLPVAEELFLSGTTTEIMPVTKVDGRLVGSGRPGPVTQRLQQEYRARV